MRSELIYETTLPFLKVFLPLAFFTATIFAYFFHAHLLVVAFLAFCLMAHAFKDYPAIKVYGDHFKISYSNIFGRLMSIDQVFYYKDIIEFKYDDSRFRPNLKQAAFMVAVVSTLAAGEVGRITKASTNIFMKYKNASREVINRDIELVVNGSTYTKALRLIQERIMK